MFRVIVIGVTAATIFQYPYAAELLVGLVGIMMGLYYWLLLNVVSGLKTMQINWEDRESMHDGTIAVIASAVATATLIITTQYYYIGFIAIPWILISFLSTLFGWLLHIKFLGIKDVDDSDDE